MTWTWLRNGKLKREIEFLLITALNNAIKTNYVHAKIDITRQNSNCSLCEDRYETVSHIMNEANWHIINTRFSTTEWVR